MVLKTIMPVSNEEDDINSMPSNTESPVKTWKLIGVSSESMEIALKSLQITSKVLTRRTNALWDLLLSTEQQAKELAGSILNTKHFRLQTEYMGSRRTKVTIHGVPVDIPEDRMGTFFAKYGEVNALISKAAIAKDDLEVQVTVSRESFGEIPNTLVCRDKRMLVVIVGRRQYCWPSSASGHMAKECPDKSTQSSPRPA